MSKLLRQFINEAVLCELRRDDAFIAHLKKQAGIGTPRTPSGIAARKIAAAWISDMEAELGKKFPPMMVPQVNKFVASRWQGVLARYRDERAALQTMNNLLDAKFNSLRMGDPT